MGFPPPPAHLDLRLAAKPELYESDNSPQRNWPQRFQSPGMRSSTTLPHFAGSSVSAVRELAVEEHDAAISGSLGGAAGGLAGAVPTTTAAQGTAAVGALVSQGPAAAG